MVTQLQPEIRPGAQIKTLESAVNDHAQAAKLALPINAITTSRILSAKSP